MRLLSLLMISSCLAACAQLPPKPEGDLCIIDIPRTRLICAPIASADNVADLYDIQKFVFENRTTIIPLMDSDKYISFSPDTWENITVYIKSLEDIVTHQHGK